MKITTNTCPEWTKIPSFFSIPCCWGHIHHQDQQTLALIDIEQLSEDQAQHLLSAAEVHYFATLRYPKRRREWLGGRIAAKIALLYPVTIETFPHLAPGLSILPDAHGRPCLEGRTQALSLSHSCGYAVALTKAGGKGCGVDLQKISTKISRLVERFATTHEVALLADQVPDHCEASRLTMLWVVKEALKKSMLAEQPSLFAGINLMQLRTLQPYIWCFTCSVQDGPAQAVFVYDFFPYFLAITAHS